MEYFCSPLQLNHRILSNSSCTVHEPVRVYLEIGIPMYLTLSKLVPLSHISGINSASENETYLGNDDLWRETLDGQSFCNGVPRTLHVHQRSWKKFSDRMEFEWHSFHAESETTTVTANCRSIPLLRDNIVIF